MGPPDTEPGGQTGRRAHTVAWQGGGLAWRGAARPRRLHPRGLEPRPGLLFRQPWGGPEVLRESSEL